MTTQVSDPSGSGIAPPRLSRAARELLTELCFGKDDDRLEPVDVLFVFGADRQATEVAAHIQFAVLGRVAKSLVIAGGRYAESAKVVGGLPREMLGRMSLHVEGASVGMVDNVRRSLGMLPMKEARKLMFLSKNYACGRARLALSRYMPHTELFQSPYDAVLYDGAAPVSSADWWMHPQNARGVWREFLRIQSLGEQGDIAYPPAVQDTVMRIRQEVGL